MYLMMFSFSPLILLAVLSTSAFAVPTETALSKRDPSLSFNFGSSSVVITLRDVEPTADKRRLSKRNVDASFTLQLNTNGAIAIKRSTEEAHEELSKRSEEYSLVVTSLLPPGNGLSGRSTDAYEGRQVLVSSSDAMVQGLQAIGVTQDQVPQYLSQNLVATDSNTGNEYQLIPANISLAVGIGLANVTLANVTLAADIVLNLDYQPTG